MGEPELDERYAKLVEALARVEDPETKQQVISLVENGFAPFDLQTLGRPRRQEDAE